MLGVYNGQFLTHRTKGWHITGWWIRALLMFGLWPDFLHMIIYINLAWAGYDLIINAFLKQKWYYQGKTAIMDKNIPPEITFGIKFVLLIIMISEIWKALL